MSHESPHILTIGTRKWNLACIAEDSHMRTKERNDEIICLDPLYEL